MKISRGENMDLRDIGWNERLEESFLEFGKQGLIPARITSEECRIYEACGKEGQFTAVVSGRMMFAASERDEYPAVGDWVCVQHIVSENKGIIQAILPRRTVLSRKVAGGVTSEQIIAVNVDTAFIVNALEGDRGFNLRRIERYLVLARRSGAMPVIVLNKIDLCGDAGSFIREAGASMPDVPVFGVSAKFGLGISEIKPFLGKGKTVVFLGSSGAGKSSLINALAGIGIQKTGDVREDDGRGRHITTSRNMVFLPDGAIVIDTPGMRELQMWADEDDLQGSFTDIQSLAGMCRFRNCRHESEPGCAVRNAVEVGALSHNRVKGFHKLKREITRLENRQQSKARKLEKSRRPQEKRWTWNGWIEDR
jgi:ribosome biogenesis GTPase / thiamine phosphate phosphatase